MKFLFFLLVATSLFSQNTKYLNDAEFKQLEDKSRLNINCSIDSSFFYANKIEVSSKKEHLAFAKGIKAYLYQLKGDVALCDENSKLAFKLINESSHSKEKIRIESLLYNYVGLINWKRNKFSDAINFFNDGKKLSISIGDKVQEIKFNNNISLIYNEIGKYDLAISISKQSDIMTDLIKKKYTLQQYYSNKSNINLNIGTYYEKYYLVNRQNKHLLDSSKYYFEKTLYYSEGSLLNKISANISLANFSYFKGDLDEAERRYLSTLGIVKENNLEANFLSLIYDLGDLYYVKEEYYKSLLYFKKVDSIYLADPVKNKLQYIQSNYNQSIIYDKLKDHDKATFHSDVFLKEYQINQKNLNNEASKINFSKENQEAKLEILKIKSKNERDLMVELLVKIFTGLVIVILVLYILKIRKEKRKINNTIDRLIVASNNRKLIEHNPQNIASNSQPITIDKQKELEILEKLSVLEEKKYYLSQDFNQQNVAKKIKTNTTYLSHIVNTNFNKSFSEYANELKINYVIDELINNPTYRKYSTQAIAESVGFKNAISFTKSFKKRAGVSPAQFIKKLDL
ncbi:helix-turn-helix domain-containing protein [Flavobacterium ardleyense]|uniref:Helix-turn-helix domain-containing protein n=1 Tax=Flavobacterium ardleyense TaxID=2038737 RepID=A0ABW5Z9U8_9FLAO